ncbi:MAG: zinc ribbon domain-containing protein [Thermoproteota archaeon]
MSEEDYKLCPRCNTKVPVYMKFCPNCGLRLDDSTIVKKQEVETKKVQDFKVFEQKKEVPKPFEEKNNEWPSKCPNCGFEIKEGEKYCPNCGFNIEVWVTRKKKGEKQTTVSYYTTPKKFFSFEGYSLEGVTPAAAMYLIWAFWNLLMAVLVSNNLTVLLLPPPFNDHSLQVFFLVFTAVALVLAAFGLLQVNPILYLFGIFVLVLLIPFSLLQLSFSLNSPANPSPTGTHQLENLLMGFLALMISAIGLIQTLRIRKYFFGD